MEKNLSMVRGDTLEFAIEVTGYDQMMDTALLTVKSSYDGDVLLQKSLSDGVSIGNTGVFGTYVYKFRVAPEDTENLDCGKYYFDVEFGVNDDKITVMRGLLDIVYNVT